MSLLFTHYKIGNIEIRNRFIASACEDSAATETGLITGEILKRYHLLARGETGLIISTHMSVHPLGRSRKKQLGIHRDDMIPGLSQLSETVHEHEAKIIFQLGHAGLQSDAMTIGKMPSGPCGEGQLDIDSIHDVIRSFIDAAGRAVEAGADGVQIHAAHGYLLNEFLSPYYNIREDEWGGTAENSFRILSEIISGIKTILPSDKILMVKLNTNDYTTEEGITPLLAVDYAGRLANLGIDALEVSCGTSIKSPWNMCRGEVPVQEMLLKFPLEKRSYIEKILNNMAGKYDLVEGYNLHSALLIKPVMGNIPVIPVGGWRNLHTMEEKVTNGDTDLISICRPLIREPDLVKKFRTGKTDRASCTSCNRCLAALANDMPVRCYIKGF